MKGSIHETLGSERFRSQGSIHETLGSVRFRSQGSIHETLGHFSKYGMCLHITCFVFYIACFLFHSMFSVTHNMSKRKTVPVHQLLGFSHGLIFSVAQGHTLPELCQLTTKLHAILSGMYLLPWYVGA